ncbi:MAG: hypothetical protein L6R43_12390 [Planctomycetes bacterium]|nr:hypothetical protein [Planctomycetota bacterium]
MKPWLTAFLAGAAVTAACLPPAAAAAAEDAAALVAKGRTLLGKNDYPAARDAFLAAVRAEPGNAEARRGAAETLLGLGQSEDAIAHAIAGLDATADRDAGLWLLLARGYEQKGDRLPATEAAAISEAYADARAKAAQALKFDPSLNAARSIVAKVSRIQGDLDLARSTLEEGLGKSPRDFGLLFEQGMLRFKEQKYAAALESFSKACESDPGSSEAQLQRGHAFAFTRDWESAYAAYARAAILDTANRRPLQALAKYAKDGSPKWFRAILKEKPDHAWAHAYLAYFLAWAKAKDEAGALSEMKAALALAEGDAELVAWSGLVNEGLGRGEEALKQYIRAFQADPMVKMSYDKLVERATAPPPYSNAKPDERKVLVELVTSKREVDGVFWNNLGLYHRDVTKDYRESLEAYLKAAELSPGDQGIQNDTGLVYLYHGKSIGEDQRKGLPFFMACFALVDEEGQTPQMGYRDTLENLSVYYMEVEKDPEKALLYATMRNDPDFLRNLDPSLATPSQRAAAVKAWAEGARKR